MIILSQEFNDIIDDFGHQVVLVRANKRQECNCLHRITRSANPNCKLCLGQGYVNSSKIIKVRNVMKYSLENYKFQEIGNTVVNQNTFYLKADDRPEQDDLIVQVAFTDDGIPYIDEYSNVYLIDNVAPLREELGKIAFFCCTTEAQPMHKVTRLSNTISILTKNDPQAYEISLGEDKKFVFTNGVWMVK